MKTKVYKLELMIVNHDKLSEEEIKEVVEETHYPNRCIMPHVMNIDSREVDWDDSHPLNMLSSMKETFKKLFE